MAAPKRNAKKTTPAPAPVPAAPRRNLDTKTVGTRNMPKEAVNTRFNRGGPEALRAAKANVVLPAGRFKVRALAPGFYNNKRRRIGDVFVLAGAQAFSKRWMEVVNPTTPTRTTTGLQHLKKTHDEILTKTEGGRKQLPREADPDNPDDEEAIFE